MCKGVSLAIMAGPRKSRLAPGHLDGKRLNVSMSTTTKDPLVAPTSLFEQANDFVDVIFVRLFRE